MGFQRSTKLIAGLMTATILFQYRPVVERSTAGDFFSPSSPSFARQALSLSYLMARRPLTWAWAQPYYRQLAASIIFDSVTTLSPRKVGGIVVVVASVVLLGLIPTLYADGRRSYRELNEDWHRARRHGRRYLARILIFAAILAAIGVTGASLYGLSLPIGTAGVLTSGAILHLLWVSSRVRPRRSGIRIAQILLGAALVTLWMGGLQRLDQRDYSFSQIAWWVFLGILSIGSLERLDPSLSPWWRFAGARRAA
jgi:hypothetical protein